MSHDRQHGKIIFECDCCDETLETNESVFINAVEVKRSAGWGTDRAGVDWIDLCPRHRVKSR